MATRIPKVWSLTERAVLEYWVEEPQRGEQLVDIQVDTEQWFQWLKLPTSRSFRFEPADPRIANFAVRKEVREDRDYWYAYKKVEGELYDYLIGTSQDLTLARLREIGLQLQQPQSKQLAFSQPIYAEAIRLIPNAECQELEPSLKLKQENQGTFTVESEQVSQLKQEIQRLQDELANSRQSYRVACQEYQETIQQLHHQNQLLHTERDQLKEELQQFYARNGDLKLSLMNRSAMK